MNGLMSDLSKLEKELALSTSRRIRLLFARSHKLIAFRPDPWKAIQSKRSKGLYGVLKNLKASERQTKNTAFAATLQAAS